MVYRGGVVGKSPLATELDRRGIRYVWMAGQLGVRKWTFSRIERGVVKAPAGFYEQAAQILGVDPDAIRPATEGVAA